MTQQTVLNFCKYFESVLSVINCAFFVSLCCCSCVVALVALMSPMILCPCILCFTSPRALHTFEICELRFLVFVTCFKRRLFQVLICYQKEREEFFNILAICLQPSLKQYQKENI